MNILGHLTVLPQLPAELSRLDELAHNLYWSWQADARQLFRLLDRDLWQRGQQNPVAFLRDVSQERLDQAATDPDYLAAYQQVLDKFDAYLAQPSWFDTTIGTDHVYAYLCAEYGWTEAVTLYSGGLGVLAGDHTKAASDLGVPLVAVGLYYPEGYFHQRVAEDGTQEAVYQRSDPLSLPFRRISGDDGEPVTVTVRVFGSDVKLEALETHVGSVRVVLLDADVEGNSQADRDLLLRLYGGDHRTRVAQEMLLGLGGVRMLRALGVTPTAWHMNEGHSAFSVLERCRELVAAGLGFDEARAAVTASTLFTVHTPIAAGNDAFDFGLIEKAFGGAWGNLGLRQEEFLALGRADHGWGPVFSMPALAIRFSSGRNGVAELHGETSRQIWADLWPGVPLSEVPIGHVTNGVHLPTWLAPEMQELVDEVLPAGWRQRPDDIELWQPLREVSPERFWEARLALKARSVRFLRRRLLSQLARYEASPTELQDSSSLFNPEHLTIGFARRFASYKRATLIFRDLDRLAAIMNDPARPVQLVFAGKAHPADTEGQQLIATIQRLSSDPRFDGRIMFVEDYDMAIGRALTRGVDVWLNNPRRPLEASGTSGMKAAMNGVLNLSVLDGWWPEGYDGINGWAIGAGQVYEDEARSDAADADDLYALLEREVIPLYYQRNGSNVPLGWAERAADAVASISPRFNAMRMVKQYVTRYYAPASERGAVIASNEYEPARALAAWGQHVREAWPTVSLTAVPLEEELRHSDEELNVEALLRPGELNPDDIQVELLYGPAEEGLETELQKVTLEQVGAELDGRLRYRVRFKPAVSGRLAYGVRAYAVNSLLSSPFDSHAIIWAERESASS